VAPPNEEGKPMQPTTEEELARRDAREHEREREREREREKKSGEESASACVRVRFQRCASLCFLF